MEARRFGRSLLGLVACAALLIGGHAPAHAELSVVTTTTDLASLTEQLGGERVDQVRSLTRPLEDPHYLNATPRMIVQITQADLFVENGMDLEVGWLPAVLRQTRNRDVRPGGDGYVDASRGIEAIQVPDEPLGQLRRLGDVHPQGNPHFTLEPVTAIRAARNVAAGLARVDPDYAEKFAEKFEAYRERAHEVLQAYQQRFEAVGDVRVIIYHKHFDYMFEQLGIEVVASIEPRPGIEPSARHIANLIRDHSPENVDLVVMEPWHNERVARQVADAIGVPLQELCPAVGSCDDTGTIIDLFRTNAERILAHFEEDDDVD